MGECMGECMDEFVGAFMVTLEAAFMDESVGACGCFRGFIRELTDKMAHELTHKLTH